MVANVGGGPALLRAKEYLSLCRTEASSTSLITSDIIMKVIIITMMLTFTNIIIPIIINRITPELK